MDWHRRYLQQAGWTAPLRRFVFQHIGVRDGDHILEVGCGTGAVLSSLPELSGSVEINLFGLDIERESLRQAAANSRRAHLTQADAHRLPFPDDRFDILYCHFLLLWLNDPLAALIEMRRAARPGGFVVAFAEPDYGGRLDHPAELSELGRLQEQSLRRQGADARLGRRLKALFQQAGLIHLESGVLGAQWAGQPSPEEIQLEWQVLENDLKAILSKERLTRLRQIDWDAWQARERILYIPTFYAFGQKPHSA